MAAWVFRAVRRARQKAKVDAIYAEFFGSVARYAVMLLAVLWSLTFFGVSSTSIMAVLGAAGLAIVLAMKDFLAHGAAGVMLMATKPFQVGDYITCGSFEGKVKRLTLFKTELNTTQNHRIFMPNKMVWDMALINHTYNSMRMVELRVQVKHEFDLTGLMADIRREVPRNPLILKKPEPLVELDSVAMNDAGAVVLVRCWCKTEHYGKIRHTLPETVHALMTRPVGKTKAKKVQ
jgi:small conductance mechanosensitive channel